MRKYVGKWIWMFGFFTRTHIKWNARLAKLKGPIHSSFLMSHVPAAPKNQTRKRQQQADNNRFVFVSLQKYLCILLAFLCLLLILQPRSVHFFRLLLRAARCCSENGPDANCVWLCETSEFARRCHKYCDALRKIWWAEISMRFVWLQLCVFLEKCYIMNDFQRIVIPFVPIKCTHEKESHNTIANVLNVCSWSAGWRLCWFLPRLRSDRMRRTTNYAPFF